MVWGRSVGQPWCMVGVLVLLAHCRSCLPSPSFQGSSVRVIVESNVAGWSLELRDGLESTRARREVLGRGEAVRGLTLTVLNPHHGSVVFHKVFPLWQYWAHWVDLQWHLQHVAAGRLVVLAFAGTGSVGIRGAAPSLTALGSLMAAHLPPRARWTWVFIKGGRTICETSILEGKASQKCDSTIALLPSHLTLAPVDVLEQRRWQYCMRHGAMGGLCDENSPDPLPLTPAPTIPQQQVLEHVPVVVTAGTRHQYLYHSLRTLLATPGAQFKNLLVVLGDAPLTTTQLLELLNITYITLPVNGYHNNKLFAYYHNVFRAVAARFPNAPAVIFLDEDIEVSPDFFSFLSQTLPLLSKDSSLYCINAYSPLLTKDYVRDERRVQRGVVQVEWGYVVTLDFVREALSVWNKDSQPNTLMYDFWLYLNVRKGRECLFPEVSRTKHYGIGINTIAQLHERGPQTMPLVQQASIKLYDINSLLLSNWKINLQHNISQAVPLQGNPCSSSFLPQWPSAPHYVFYYALDRLEEDPSRPDPFQYFNTAECLKIWSLSEQGHHDGVSILHFSTEATLYVVGVPYSSYSRYRPPFLPLWDVDTLTDKDFEMMRNFTQSWVNDRIVIKNQNVTTDVLASVLSEQQL